jgi:hypothetical protein
MKFLIALLLLTSFQSVNAATLKRTAKVLAPAPFTLQKDFFRTVTVPDTCTANDCHTEEYDVPVQSCHTEYSTEYVCDTPWVCDSEGKCEYQNVCEYRQVSKEVCETKMDHRYEEECNEYEYKCDKTKKIVDRSWKVTVQPIFDPRAILTAKKTEQFDVQLKGDERAPQITVKVKKSPFKYFIEPAFLNEKEAKIEFRLDESPPAQK